MATTVAIDRMSEFSALIFVSSAMIYTDDQICENEVPNARADLRGHFGEQPRLDCVSGSTANGNQRCGSDMAGWAEHEFSSGLAESC
jgi:hypothetical protein